MKDLTPEEKLLAIMKKDQPYSEQARYKRESAGITKKDKQEVKKEESCLPAVGGTVKRRHTKDRGKWDREEMLAVRIRAMRPRMSNTEIAVVMGLPEARIEFLRQRYAIK